MKAWVSKKFAKQINRYSRKIQNAFGERLKLFLIDPNHEILKNHALTGKWKGFRSINISGDLRAIYEPRAENLAYFVAFGTHSQLYR